MVQRKDWYIFTFSGQTLMTPLNAAAQREGDKKCLLTQRVHFDCTVQGHANMFKHCLNKMSELPCHCVDTKRCLAGKPNTKTTSFASKTFCMRDTAMFRNAPVSIFMNQKVLYVCNCLSCIIFKSC